MRLKLIAPKSLKLDKVQVLARTEDSIGVIDMVRIYQLTRSFEAWRVIHSYISVNLGGLKCTLFLEEHYYIEGKRD